MESLVSHKPFSASMPNEAWTEINSLNNIKNEQDPDEALKKVAKQFESLFFNMLLKNMRKANEAFEVDSLFTNNESRMYRDMYDNQLSLNLGAKTGIGIADAMYRQLKGNQSALAYQNKMGEVDEKALKQDFERFKEEGFPLDHDKVASRIKGLIDDEGLQRGLEFDGGNKGFPLDMKSMLFALQNVYKDKTQIEDEQDNFSGVQETSNSARVQLDDAKSESTKSESTKVENAKSDNFDQNIGLQNLKSGALQEQPSKEKVRESQSFLPESPKEFIQGVLPYVKKAAKHIGVNPLVMLAQAALETGWGKHILKDDANGSSNNLFNIKADARWQGDKTRHSTLEFIDGLPQKQMANFRRYSSIADSVNDFVDFIRANPRYENALAEVNDDKNFVSELHEAGYATDPKYSQKILRILDQLKADHSVQRLLQDEGS